ncbi:MAG: glutamate synthase-related protein [Methanosphaera sp.]|uniref:glutamate synthase-related protein n=1 Tax=Methanosphaera sp. TaxID=2666342 RepID=UPI0025F799D5|nr:glutamate synthase-related protein [Methanosphaera sp.]MCI5867830.1 glutamate synthase-related protein [Methanosphaera sp.]MDD6534840.1 glutamate synthase-related protein [Methanosphaera sp.]MDY3955300.1 glutamate synthase-related protein [Methanosphaera sp.]
MAFFVNRRSEICKSKNNRPGCCGYLCDKPREKNCKNCYSCYVNCPHDVYEVINDEPMAVHQERCVGCRICEGMCPTNAIYIQSMPDETRGVWDASTISEIRRKTQTGNYKVRGCGATRHIPTFDDLSILPAQVSRPPIDSYREPCNTKVTLGARFAENPIEIGTPIMIGAMSFGAVSKETKLAFARGATLANTIANTGEGGMLPEERKYADKLIAQYASGRFGVSAEYLNNADAVEIKIGQGAKSGMGGHLLAHKVTAEVAKIRNIPEGVDALSPARHMDIVGPEDLAMKISQLRDITDWKVPIIVKFTAGRVKEDVKIAAKAGADIIVIDGMQGGTGAAPDVIVEHSGIPTIEAIVKADEALKEVNLRSEVNLVAAGGIRSGADVAKAIALGADATYIATSALIAIGCNVCQACSNGRCPKGIATQERTLRRRLDPVRSGQNLANYINAMTKEAEMLTQQAGNTDLQKLEKQDLVALSMEASQITGVPLI